MEEVEKYLYAQLAEVQEHLNSYVAKAKKNEAEYEKTYLTMTCYYDNFELGKSDNYEVYTAKSFEFSEKRREVAFKVQAMQKDLQRLIEQKSSIDKLIFQYADTYIAIKTKIRRMFGGMDD